MYKNMFGLNDIDNTSGNTTFYSGAFILDKLYVSNLSILSNDTTMLNKLYVSGTTTIKNNTSINSNLFVSGNCIFNNLSFNSSLNVSGNTNILNNLYVSNNSIINNSCTILSNLNVNDTAYINNNLYCSNIYPINNSININSDIINIGTTTSNINIFATSLYIATNELSINDRIMTLNINANNIDAFDIGNSSGIEILSDLGESYIKTSDDGSKFIIKAPIDSTYQYISTTDNVGENYYVSGNVVLYQPTTICSQIYVSGNTYLNGSTTFLSVLNILGDLYCQGSTSILSSLSINNNSLLLGDITLNSSLNVNGNIFINGNTEINSEINILSNANIGGNITILSLLNVSGNSIFYNDMTVKSYLNVGNNAIIEGNVSILSIANISGNSIINGNTNVIGSIIVSGNSIINNISTINSSLSVSGNTSLNGNITLLSDLNINSNIICPLIEFANDDAAKLGGIPIGGLYRTGGIVKIKVNDQPPILTLNGNSSIYINPNTIFNDPGVTAIDIIDGNIPVYMYYLGSTTNTLLNNILISGSTLITQTSILNGLYTAMYQATNSDNYTGYISRLLQIGGPQFILYNSSIIRYSYRQGQTYQVLPVFTTNPYQWYWSPPYNTNGFGGSGVSWALSSSYLSSINFNYDSSWCFVFKGTRTSSNQKYIQFCFDNNLSDWGPQDNAGQNDTPLGYRINNTNSNGPGFPSVFYSSDNILNSGVYFNISYDYTTRYIKFEVVDLLGNIFISSTSSAYTFVNKIVPWHIYHNNDTYTFNNGILYNSQGYINYSSYSSYFS